MLSNLLLLLVCVYACSAHLCLLSPPQRSPLKDINKAGSGSCFLVSGPCGKIPRSDQKLYLEEGKNFTVVFQKNLDHFNAKSPGFFSLSIGSEMTGFKEMYKLPDTNTSSLSLYVATITAPKLNGSKLQNVVLQAQYVTKNPKAPAVFYQCSDIIVTKAM